MENSPSFSTAVPQLRFGKIEDLSHHVAPAVDATRRHLFSQQHEDGYWVFALEADATIPAEYILLQHYLSTIDSELEQRTARYLRAIQGEHGGWPLFRGGDLDITWPHWAPTRTR